MDSSIRFRQGIFQEYATVGVSLVGTAAALAAGYAADSIALTGFGIDSALRAAFAGITAWQLGRPFRGKLRTYDSALHERRGLFVTGVSFFLLALYVLHESGSRLYYSQKPDSSITGIIVSILLCISAVILSVLKLRKKRRPETPSVRASSSMTAQSAYLSVVLFLGVFFHFSRNWWWADPAAALLMIPAMARSGWECVERSKGDNG